MEPIKNMLVCLDGSEMDNVLLKYARFIARSNKVVEAVYCINVLRNFLIPDDVKKEFPDLENQAISQRKKELEAAAESVFSKEPQLKMAVIVTVGSGLHTILKATEDLEINLLLVGSKTNISGHGVLTQGLARRCPCNILIVPHGSEQKIERESGPHRILVPVDFSAYSKLALEHAVQIAEAHEDTEIVCQHVYRVPTGYHYSGKTHDQFADIMRGNSKDKFNRFIRDIDTKGQKVREVYTLDDNEDIVQDIYDKAKEEDVTGIIFGSKGISAASSYFLGSTAEKLTRIDGEFPLLAVRKPGEYKRIIDVLKNI